MQLTRASQRSPALSPRPPREAPDTAPQSTQSAHPHPRPACGKDFTELSPNPDHRGARVGVVSPLSVVFFSLVSKQHN